MTPMIQTARAMLLFLGPLCRAMQHSSSTRSPAMDTLWVTLASNSDVVSAVPILALAILRAVQEAKRGSWVLMQGAPIDQLQSIDKRLVLVRSLPGVRHTQDECFWPLDDERLVGSFSCVLEPHAPKQTLLEARSFFADVFESANTGFDSRPSSLGFPCHAMPCPPCQYPVTPLSLLPFYAAEANIVIYSPVFRLF